MVKIIACGCLHDEVIKHFPEFSIFVKLHLSDFNGVPIYAVENGFYHLDSLKDVEFCELYRISKYQYIDLKKAENKTGYLSKLIKLGIIDNWEAQAKEGTKILETLTGDTFINDSKRSNLGNFKP